MKKTIVNKAITFEPGVIDMAKRSQEMGLADKIVLMPDVHIGKGSAIGFTAPMTDKICPNVIGQDIGCGMTIWKLGKGLGEYLEIANKVIHKVIPSGFDPRNHTDKHPSRETTIRHDLFMREFIAPTTKELQDTMKSPEWFLRQLGSLGSGNHFIEINVDDEGEYYLVIHSGSRGFGVHVNKIWQNKAIEQMQERLAVDIDPMDYMNQKIPDKDKAYRLAQDMAKKAKINFKLTPEQKEMAYLTGEDAQKYLQDMRVAQEYAYWNRGLMADLIFREMPQILGIDKETKLVTVAAWFDSTHNFIGKDNIIRKGATSAYEGELLLIPINMHDGTIIAVGKGNKDWNFSAPHGAGRLMSRTRARNELSLEDFIDSMKGIVSTTVSEKTLDEAPLTYKSMDEIIKATKDTIDIIKIIKPVLSFKGVN